MVSSIALVLDKPLSVKKIFDLINEKYNIEKYNNGERESIEHGFTFKETEKIEKMCREIIGDFDTPINCDCEFCKKVKTTGNLIVRMFGFTLRSSYWFEKENGYDVIRFSFFKPVRTRLLPIFFSSSTALNASFTSYP